MYVVSAFSGIGFSRYFGRAFVTLTFKPKFSIPAYNIGNYILNKSLLILLITVKIFYYLKISDGFSFLVSMLFSVFIDLKFFLMVYLIVLFTFGSLFLALDTGIGTADEY